MLRFLVFGTFLLSGLTVPVRSACVDSATHTFDNDDGFEVGCSWLTDDPIEEATRVAEYCPRPNVKFMCADTCDTCDEECADNPVYVFRQLILNVFRRCSWISEIPSQIDIRRDGYCDSVGIFCPEACGFCPDPEITMEPSSSPSGLPSVMPSNQPSSIPSSMPSSAPSKTPSSTPSNQPSENPSVAPSDQPSLSPSSMPSSTPSMVPSSKPSAEPSANPSTNPSSAPSAEPSATPSVIPSPTPSAEPSSSPSAEPSLTPSVQPSANPSVIPSSKPSLTPSVEPSSSPSSVPSFGPQTCEDSILPFWRNIDTTAVCSDIGNGLNPRRCDESYVASHCPATCGRCTDDEFKCADSQAIFVHEGKLLYCEWLSDLDEQREIDQKCSDDDVKLTCRSLCGYCGRSLIDFDDDVSLSDTPYYSPYSSDIIHMENIGAFHGDNFQTLFPAYPGISNSVISGTNAGAIYYPGDFAIMVCPEGNFDMISLYATSITGVLTSLEIVAFDEFFQYVDEKIVLLTTTDEATEVTFPPTFDNIRAVSISNADEIAIGLEDIQLFINSPCFGENSDVLSQDVSDFLNMFHHSNHDSGVRPPPKTFLGFNYDDSQVSRKRSNLFG